MYNKTCPWLNRNCFLTQIYLLHKNLHLFIYLFFLSFLSWTSQPPKHRSKSPPDRERHHLPSSLFHQRMLRFRQSDPPPFRPTIAAPVHHHISGPPPLLSPRDHRSSHRSSAISDQRLFHLRPQQHQQQAAVHRLQPIKPSRCIISSHLAEQPPPSPASSPVENAAPRDRRCSISTFVDDHQGGVLFSSPSPQPQPRPPSFLLAVATPPVIATAAALLPQHLSCRRSRRPQGRSSHHLSLPLLLPDPRGSQSIPLTPTRSASFLLLQPPLKIIPAATTRGLHLHQSPAASLHYCHQSTPLKSDRRQPPMLHQAATHLQADHHSKLIAIFHHHRSDLNPNLAATPPSLPRGHCLHCCSNTICHSHRGCASPSTPLLPPIATTSSSQGRIIQHAAPSSHHDSSFPASSTSTSTSSFLRWLQPSTSQNLD